MPLSLKEALQRLLSLSDAITLKLTPVARTDVLLTKGLGFQFPKQPFAAFLWEISNLSSQGSLLQHFCGKSTNSMPQWLPVAPNSSQWLPKWLPNGSQGGSQRLPSGSQNASQGGSQWTSGGSQRILMVSPREPPQAWWSFAKLGPLLKGGACANSELAGTRPWGRAASKPGARG